MIEVPDDVGAYDLTLTTTAAGPSEFQVTACSGGCRAPHLRTTAAESSHRLALAPGRALIRYAIPADDAGQITIDLSPADD